MISESAILTIGSAIAGAIVWMFGSNMKLRDQLSDLLLKKLNKTKINHIDLKKHRIFTALAQKRSSFTYFIMDEPVKIEFYKRYVEIKFTALEDMALRITELANEKGDITNEVFKAIETVTKTIDEELYKQLVIPQTIDKKFHAWRAMLRASFKDSLRDILNDDLVDSNYFIAYRALDTMIAHVKTILHSGTLEFSRMNGAFKTLEIKDILRNDNKSTSK